LLVVGAGLLVIALVAAGIGWWAWRDLDSNIETSKDFEKILTERPQLLVTEDDKKPRNILILGTDSREGQEAVGGASPGLSDTTILLNISADRRRASAVSVPRDLIVDRPVCRSKNNEDVIFPAADNQMWNTAYALGGAACTIAQFEQMTGIRVTNFLLTRFQAVKDVAGALGGVPICMPYEIDDPANSIYLPEGRYDAKGDVAVSYVRVRYKIGNEGDLGRLKRQQVFLASMLNKASSLGTMANPMRFYDFLTAATRSVVSDPELGNLSDLIGLQRNLKRIGLDNVVFLTMPVGPYAPDPNRLAPGPDADLLWQDLRTDRRLHYRFIEDATKGTDVADDGAAVPSSTPVQRDGIVVDQIRLAAAPLRAEGISDEEAEEFGLCPSS
jgi:LCP family protein required for cell wall assembly